MQIEAGTDRADASEIASAARAFDVPLVSFFPELPVMSEHDDDFENRLPDIETLLRLLAKRGQLEEAYRTLWKLALS